MMWKGEGRLSLSEIWSTEELCRAVTSHSCNKSY